MGHRFYEKHCANEHYRELLGGRTIVFSSYPPPSILQDPSCALFRDPVLAAGLGTYRPYTGRYAESYKWNAPTCIPQFR